MKALKISIVCFLLATGLKEDLITRLIEYYEVSRVRGTNCWCALYRIICSRLKLRKWRQTSNKKKKRLMGRGKGKLLSRGKGKLMSRGKERLTSRSRM